MNDNQVELLFTDGTKKIVDSASNYSGNYARRTGQQVFYVTERAVFRLGDSGLILTEIAPGVDLEKDILSQMDFIPEISSELKEMDARIFVDQPLGGCGQKKEDN